MLTEPRRHTAAHRFVRETLSALNGAFANMIIMHFKTGLVICIRKRRAVFFFSPLSFFAEFTHNHKGGDTQKTSPKFFSVSPHSADNPLQSKCQRIHPVGRKESAALERSGDTNMHCSNIINKLKSSLRTRDHCVSSRFHAYNIVDGRQMLLALDFWRPWCSFSNPSPTFLLIITTTTF